jgi:hypothetical protein
VVDGLPHLAGREGNGSELRLAGIVHADITDRFR